MDFNDTPQEAAYRDEARSWLRANAPKRAGGPDNGLDDPANMEECRAWQRKKAEAGYACITWPKQWGGGGGAQWQSVIFGQEEGRFETPGNPFQIGLAMCVPTVMTVGNEADKERFVRPAVRGEEIWCQLFSEPAGGSDVAAARTRAVRDGEDWVINGQKVWTSGAHYSDFGLLLARTDPDVPKHKGLTMFWIDMHAPGVEVRPIHQMSGASNFNEVFFTDLRVPDAQRRGAPGQGWKVAITTLMNERLAGGEIRRPDMQDLIELARTVELDGRPAIADPAVRERIADWHARSQGLTYTRLRILTALSRGETPGPENSIAKVVNAAKLQEIASFGMDLLGMAGAVMDPALAPMHAMFQDALLSSPSHRIAGGTDEILRNIIAERVLGLPGDMRAAKEL